MDPERINEVKTATLVTIQNIETIVVDSYIVLTICPPISRRSGKWIADAGNGLNTIRHSVDALF